MTVRAKFQVQEVTTHSWSATSKTIVLRPCYDQTIPEDKRFCDATPSGEFRMLVNNPVAIEALAPGKYYYIDITPVE